MPDSVGTPSELAVAMFSRSFVPFIGTFGKTEYELAAGVIVATMARCGDTFAPVSKSRIAEAVVASEDHPNWGSVITNPFLYPDFGGLIEAGWARYVGDDDIEFTPAAFERFREKGWIA